MLALFLRFGQDRAWWSDSLSEHAYGIYVLHYVFVVWLQYMLLGTEFARSSRVRLCLRWPLARVGSSAQVRLGYGAVFAQFRSRWALGKSRPQEAIRSLFHKVEYNNRGEHRTDRHPQNLILFMRWADSQEIVHPQATPMVAPLSHPIVTWFTRAFITALPSAVRVATCVGPCAAATEPISARVVTK